MTEAYIFDHVRTPRGRGRPDGSLHEVPAVELLTQVLRAMRERNDLDTSLLDDVVIGTAQPVGEQGSVIARTAVLHADYAQTVPGQQIHRFCASGLEAVNNVAAQIMSGMSQAGIGGGVEAMSRITMGSDTGAWISDPRIAVPQHFIPQGISADLIATIDGYSREDVDAYAAESQRRAAESWDRDHFAKSIVPITDILGEQLLDHDEHRRPGTTVESLSTLKPAFTNLAALGFDAVAIAKYPQVERIRHVHTGGNSSGIVDGASGVLIGSASFGRDAGLTPRARIRGFASIGSEPTIMLTAPDAVSRKALRNCGMEAKDIDLWEINEAFASVVLRYMRAMNLDPGTVNVAGGSIALGHPLGATGAMILGTVLDELERRNLNSALVTLCAGNGLGTATIIERI